MGVTCLTPLPSQQSYYVVDEDIGTLTVTVTREGASDAFVSFSWRVTFLEADTASPSDVLVASGDAVLREGATVTTFPVSVQDVRAQAVKGGCDAT